MYPHERSLVQRLNGKPFVLLGVNSDPKERLGTVAQRENMTWRSWWDGGNTSGPIATGWGIEGWPTLYLIDHKGILREKYLGSPGESDLGNALDKLIREAEAAGN